MTLTAKEPSAATPPGAASPGTDPVTTQGGPGQLVKLGVALAAITAVFLAAGLGDLLLFIVILVIIVMLHELGHFATAKWSGMKVTEFFVGFGPRLWSFRQGETEYGFKAIPAGGYVKITGFTVLENVAEEDEPRAYRQAPFWKRIVVGSAGSAMHFVMAIVLALIAALTFGVPSNTAKIAGLDHWVGIARTPAQSAGLAVGDVVLAVNGKPLDGVNALIAVIGRSTGKPVSLRVERDGSVRTVTVVPHDGRGVKLKGDGGGVLAPADAKTPKGYIGVELSQPVASASPWGALTNAFSTVGSYTSAEVSGLVRTFSASGISSIVHQVTNSSAATKAADNPSTSVRPVSLVGITSLGVQAQKAGLYALLQLLILINIIFGMLNMLPMLPLDGGHVSVAVYEWIRTRKGAPYYRADITKMFPVVFVFLSFLAVFVFAGVFLDITHPIQNVFGP